LAYRGAPQALKSSDSNWTFFTTAALFEPGKRTGKSRLGNNQLIIGDKGDSRISPERYAIAMVGELETPSTSVNASLSALTTCSLRAIAPDRAASTPHSVVRRGRSFS
jgi:hypothetical protein